MVEQDDGAGRVTGLDHLVLVCTDVARTLAWYAERLGLEPLRVEAWRAGEAPFPSARIDAGTIIDFLSGAAGEGHGHLDHLCLVLEPTDLAAFAAARGLEVLEGPVPRYGARGMGTSVYVFDHDGTVVELRHYGPV